MGGGQDHFHGEYYSRNSTECTCEWDESPGDNYGQGGEPYILKKNPSCPQHGKSTSVVEKTPQAEVEDFHKEHCTCPHKTKFETTFCALHAAMTVMNEVFDEKKKVEENLRTIEADWKAKKERAKRFKKELDRIINGGD